MTNEITSKETLAIISERRKEIIVKKHYAIEENDEQTYNECKFRLQELRHIELEILHRIYNN